MGLIALARLVPFGIPMYLQCMHQFLAHHFPLTVPGRPGVKFAVAHHIVVLGNIPEMLYCGIFIK